MNKDTKGTVFNVQGYTVNDGPGIRTEFFLKGCTLKCLWCSNPESQKLKKEINIGYKCISLKECGWCHKFCPEIEKKPFIYDRGYVVGVNRSICDTCTDMKCAKMCPSNNLRIWGKEMTVEECMEILRKERSTFQRSGGGVTVSGGESLMQWEFVRDLCQAAQAEGIHTCVETALHVPEEWLKAVMPYVDLFISDIKHMDTDIHKKYTGAGNELTLSNLKVITDADKPLVLRIPIIPGVNDDWDNLGKTADFINNELGGKILQLQLLRYRKLGEEKYQSLGLPYPDLGFEAPTRELFEAQIKRIGLFLQNKGIPAVAGTTKKIPGF